MKRLSSRLLAFVKTIPRGAKQALLLALDVLLVPIALIASSALAQNQFFALQWFGRDVALTLVLMVIGGALSLRLGLPKIQLKSYELSSVGRSALLAGSLTLVLWGVTFLGFSRADFSVSVVFALVYLCLNVLVRIAILMMLVQIYRHDGGETRVLIYGAGSTGMQLALALKAHVSIRVWGFVDDNPSLHGMNVAGTRVFPPQRLAKLIESYKIDRVLIAMPSLTSPKQARIAQRLAKLGVDVQALPSFGQLVGKEEMVDKLASVLPPAYLNREARDADLAHDLSAYRGKTVLISGAGGSIGSEIARQIVHAGPSRVVLLELNEFALFSIERELRALLVDVECEIVPVLGSVTSGRLVGDVLRRYGVHVVLHAAAYKHVAMVERNAEAGVYNNVFGTHVIASCAADAGVERFILISTDKAVRPIGLMGATKRLAEIAVMDVARRSAATRFAMVRFGNVLGSSGSVVPLFEEQILAGGPVTLTDMAVTRYFMTIPEAVKLVLTAGDMAQGGEIFVLDMGEPVRIYDLACQIIDAAGYTLRSSDNPDGDIEIKVIGLQAGEKLHEELSISHRFEPTAHPKILSAPDRHLSEFETARALQELRDTLDKGDEALLVEQVMRWLRRDLEQNDEAFGIRREKPKL